jgi:hypothetical protein
MRNAMTKALRVKMLGVLCVAVFSACMATVGVDDEAVADGYPPDAYIATTAPVYYNGVAAYWWGNQWYYRGGGGWRTWRSEPAALHASRYRGAPVRTYYGRAHGGGYRR